MKSWLNAWSVIIAAVLATAVSLPFSTTARTRRDFYFFDVTLTSDHAGQTQLFFDMGNGFREEESSRQPLRVERRPVTYRFMMPTGRLRALRFDPIDREGRMTLSRARIVRYDGKLIHAFREEDFHALQQVAVLEPQGELVKFATVPDAGDPNLGVDLPGPIELPYGLRQQLRAVLPVWSGVFAACLVLMGGVTPAIGALKKLYPVLQRRPLATLAAASALAVAMQCHPVVFFGMSFASPDNGGVFLYDKFPTLPGYEFHDLEEAKNSDVGALLYSHLYFPRLEREAVFTHGEWPLWNRYNLCGVPLLGQGQSMFGELLNFIPLCAGSAAWAWDLKFVLARWLYAFGLAWVVWRLTRHLGTALLMTVAGIFVGFFTYRMNHPAVFSVCYAPWVLVAWLLLRDALKPKEWLVALGALLLANWEMFNSGTVKEAYMILGCMNLAGLLLVLLAAEPWAMRLHRFAAAAGAGVIFVLLSAPWWLTFLDTLRASHTSYDFPAAMQLPPWQFIGFFEDLFYRQLLKDEAHGYPSANCLVLAGVAWLLVSRGWRRGDRGILAVAWAAVLPFCLVFMIIPESWIIRVPFVANIHHISNTFSCALLVLATILGGCGIHRCWQQLGERTWWRDLILALGFVAGLATVYFLNARGAIDSDFFRGYIPSLLLALLAMVLGLLAWRQSRRLPALVLAVAGGVVLLCWRHGEYLHTPFDTYVFNPKVRVDYLAHSDVVEQVNRRLTTPSRPAGFGGNLFSGFNQMLSWEGIYGVDALRNGYYDDLAIAGGAKKVRWWDSIKWDEEDISQLQPLHDLFNVRYYLATHSPQPREIPGLRRLGQFDLDLYESPTAWPRAFFTDRFVTYSRLESLVHMIQTGDRRPFAALAEQDVAEAGLPMRPSGDIAQRTIIAARDFHFTSNTTRFTVDATGPGLVVLTESYYPDDFRVTVNGKPAEYFRVNHAFKGVAIAQPGPNQVVFTYRPHHFSLSLWLAGSGLAALLVAPVGWLRLYRKKIVAIAPAH